MQELVDYSTNLPAYFFTDGGDRWGQLSWKAIEAKGRGVPTGTVTTAMKAIDAAAMSVNEIVASADAEVGKIRELRIEPADRRKREADVVFAARMKVSDLVERCRTSADDALAEVAAAGTAPRPAASAVGEAMAANVRSDLRALADSREPLDALALLRSKLVRALRRDDAESRIVAWLLSSDWLVDWCESRGLEALDATWMVDAAVIEAGNPSQVAARELHAEAERQFASRIGGLDQACRWWARGVGH